MQYVVFWHGCGRVGSPLHFTEPAVLWFAGTDIGAVYIYIYVYILYIYIYVYY